MPGGHKGSQLRILFNALATSSNRAYTVRLPASGGLVQAQSVEDCRDGGTGRRAGFKIQFPKGSGGSIPPPGTTLASRFQTVPFRISTPLLLEALLNTQLVGFPDQENADQDSNSAENRRLGTEFSSAYPVCALSFG